MIERITIKNFKSFKDVTLKLGRLNLFIGTNASGKSNFFDALRVLQGIGYGFTIREILDGKPKSATSEVWEGIRGGSSGIAFAFADGGRPTSLKVDGRLPGKDGSAFEFLIAFSAQEGRFREERLSVSGRTIYNCGPGRTPEQFIVSYDDNRSGGSYRAGGGPPVLTEIASGGDRRSSGTRAESAEHVAETLADMQRIDPSPALLRAYSQAYEIKRMGEHGENFAALVRMICADPPTKEAYLSWLQELRPRDVDDVYTRSGAIGEPMVMMKERGREWPAPTLSDGTLRFAALAAAFFQPDMPGIITIEEIENGIHASRLRLLVELMRSQAAAGKTQVMATTHSPIVLAWLKSEEYATTFYCKRDEETGESHILPLSEIPRFNEIVSKQPISDLFAEGWMEEAL
jgi:predicted ATPase